MKPKIICTIGPASYNSDILSRFYDKGVNFLRINLSHTNQEEIEEKVKFLKNFKIPVILDTEGAQIRTGNLKEILIAEGEEIKIHSSEITCDKNNIFFTPPNILSEFKIGDLIEVDFNSVLLSVSDISTLTSKGYIICKSIIGGVIGGRKGVHVSSKIYMPPFSEKDKFAIEIAKKYKINTFTLSFIHTKEDVLEFKKLYPEAKFYSKIETKDAVFNLKDILSLSDGVLIDRGDLSREIPLEKIPLTQKYIISTARKQNKEVFVATNTLEKMSFCLKPDKSEANDIINTILDGATGIALTKETAVGNYPAETVNTLLTLFDQVSFLNSNYLQSDNAKSLMQKGYFESDSSSVLPKPHGGKLINRFLPKPLSSGELKKLKRLKVDENVLMDLEQIAIGAFSPLEGFMLKKDFISVLDNMRLSSGVVWTLPIILQTTKDKIKNFSIGEDILLVSEDSTPYALLHLKEIYSVDKKETAKKWFGTNDLEHPGVKNFMNSGEIILGGKISLIQRRSSPYKFYELTPSQTRRIFTEKNWRKVVGFHTRNVIHCSHEFIQLEAMKNGNCDGLFVHPVIGKKKPGDFESDLIIKSYEKMERDFYPKGRVVFSTFSTFSRYAGPREAIFTALVRKNFGCSHFIIGRDHTGVKNFYSPKASHDIFNLFSGEELGIIPIKFDDVFYSDIYKKHLHESDNKTHPKQGRLNISGTQAREILRQGGTLPEWFMRKEISSIILDEIKKGNKVFVEEENNAKKTKAKIIWFTGLSGSGKTTIANKLKEKLNSKQKSVRIFDGDIIRNELHKNLGFTPEDIRENNRLILELCKKEQDKFDFILVPIISPFKDSRNLARKTFGDSFIELFVNCPIEECKSRDVKGLYQKAKEGKIENFIGIAIPYEPSENPEIELRTDRESINYSLSKILEFLKI